MKKTLITAIFAVAAAVFAGTEYELNSIKDWRKSANIKQSGDHLIVNGPTQMLSRKMYTIDPTKEYKFELDVKNLSKTPARIYIGFDTYSADGKRRIRSENVRAVPGTLCKVVKDVKKGDTVIYLDKAAAKWKNGCFIALNAKEDLSDLPNYTVLSRTVKSIEKCPEGYKVTLHGKSNRAVTAGTVVRQHRGSGPMLIAVKTLKGDKFTDVKGKVFGKLTNNDFRNDKWNKYAGKIRLLIYANWRTKTQIELKDIEFEIDDKD